MRVSKIKRQLLKAWDWLATTKSNLIQWAELRTKYRLHIMSSMETLRYIRRHECSVARYGDGELAFVMKEGYRIPFQSNSDALSQGLESALTNQNPKLLLCMPRYLNSMMGCTSRCKRSWWSWGQVDDRQKKVVTKLLELSGSNYVFGDALITRPYMDRKNRGAAKRIFRELKKLWEGQDILIIEGEQTRLGVGNDLFDNTHSVRRILAPAVGAFDCYDEILKATQENSNGTLVLLALGPTATVLAADLSVCGVRALDVGHIDIEYEWFLNKAKEKIAVKGKFTNEVNDGRGYSECHDEVYLKQVILRVNKHDS